MGVKIRKPVDKKYAMDAWNLHKKDPLFKGMSQKKYEKEYLAELYAIRREKYKL